MTAKRFLAGLLVIGIPGRAVLGDDLSIAITAGFKTHAPKQTNGGVDWTTGAILAEGKGIARGKTPQDHAMAERAAMLVAARNALAIANGIPIDANGRVSGVRNGRIELNGIVKGQKVVSTEWHPDRPEPEARVTLRVPFWGAQGVARVFFASQRAQAIRIRRVQLVVQHVDVSDAVLVIDARGCGAQPALFPAVMTADGQVIYDVATLAAPPADGAPTIRYVETELTYERLRACGPQFGDALDILTQASASPFEASFACFQDTGGATASQPASQPASRPASRRRVVVKATQATGQTKSQIVLTKEDAEKLRTSAEGASLLRSGRVVVVVDSAAAGIQGCLPPGTDEALALAQP